MLVHAYRAAGSPASYHSRTLIIIIIMAYATEASRKRKAEAASEGKQPSCPRGHFGQVQAVRTSAQDTCMRAACFARQMCRASATSRRSGDGMCAQRRLRGTGEKAATGACWSKSLAAQHHQSQHGKFPKARRRRQEREQRTGRAPLQVFHPSSSA